MDSILAVWRDIYQGHKPFVIKYGGTSYRGGGVRLLLCLTAPIHREGLENVQEEIASCARSKDITAVDLPVLRRVTSEPDKDCWIGILMKGGEARASDERASAPCNAGKACLRQGSGATAFASL